MPEIEELWIDQQYQLDRYGVALMMIREGCSDPAGLARRILSEFETPAPSPSHSETLKLQRNN